MFSKNIKSILIVTMSLVMVLSSAVLYADCDMMAMLTKTGYILPDIENGGNNFDYPNELFQFLINYSGSGTSQNPHGYGVVYYKDDESVIPESQRYYSTDHYQNNPQQMDDAIDAINEPDNNAVIVLGHDRTGTGGSGNHPFYFYWNGKTYTFQHNGYIYDESNDPDNIKQALWHDLWYGTETPGDWFVDYPSNWNINNPDEWDDFIDSELLFHFIMKRVIDHNDDVIGGIMAALNETDINGVDIKDYFYSDWTHNRINFVLSNGEALHLFRNTVINDEAYNLEYKIFESGFVGIKTQDNNDVNYPDVEQFSLVYIPRNDDCGYPIYSGALTFQNIFQFFGYAYVYGNPGDASFNLTNWSGGSGNNYYIIGDVEISEADVLEIQSNANVYFTGKHNFNINGNVSLMNDSGFNLLHGSSVIIDGSDAELFLDWGSTLTGFTPTTYEGEDIILGDRIIAQNGGIITTDDDYQNPGDAITIGSNSDELWDGIYIQTPDNEDTYWFVNCDISGISNLSIANVSETQNVANLNLYLTDFTDAGQIVARHGHNLSITGEDASTPCNISNNYQTPIVSYDSPVYIQYALIEENGRDENGGLLNTYCDGIYLNYASGDLSQILNSVIQNNTGNGISTYYNDVLIDNITIQTNEQHGLLTKEGTFDDLQNTTILNNDCAEYVGCQDSYSWSNMSNTLQDLDGNAGGNDQYILIAYRWDELEESIDVRGNTINNENNENRFFPRYEAFRFDASGITPEREMLYSALDEMRNENYSDAETIFQQVISQYPYSTEAATSIRGLLFIENYTDQDYATLIDYIDVIQVDENTPLYKAKEDVKTKSYMKDKDYETAIDRLEIVINTSILQDDVILAMIDEGYCYMELAEGGERSLPADCTVQTKTFKEYQAKVRELESQLSFNPEENKQDTIPIAGDILSLSNYPNPFNPTTTISFDLASESDVSIVVYNVKGQKVKQLMNEHLSIGQHSIEWNGKDNNNKSVSSGIYFYKISAGKSISMRKMLLLK